VTRKRSDLVIKEPTFLFCVGATKAGTSWLHRHLAAHEECHFRSLKELHYFGLSRPAQFGAALRAGREEIARLTAIMALRDDAEALKDTRIADLRDWQTVLRTKTFDVAAYKAFLTQNMGQAHVVGDVTPAYALLPVETLRTMQSVGADVRVLYLMRDPLARLWSHVRMIAKNLEPQKFAAAAMALLERILGAGITPVTKGIVARGDYASIVPKLMQAFDPKRLLVMFYEDLISLPGVAKVSKFLGIAPGRADFDRRVHKGVPLELPAEARARALVFLRPQYDFVARRFVDIPAAWRANMNEGLV
jgi:Sulfotransferase family